jgi:hypothetical protein
LGKKFRSKAFGKIFNKKYAQENKKLDKKLLQKSFISENHKLKRKKASSAASLPPRLLPAARIWPAERA